MRLDPMGNCCAVAYLFGFSTWDLNTFKKHYVERCTGYRRNVAWIGRSGPTANAEIIAKALRAYGTVNVAEGKSYGPTPLNIYYFSPTDPTALRDQFAKDLVDLKKQAPTEWK